jgi:hypothetical protein
MVGGISNSIDPQRIVPLTGRAAEPPGDAGMGSAHQAARPQARSGRFPGRSNASRPCVLAAPTPVRTTRVPMEHLGTWGA